MNSNKVSKLNNQRNECMDEIIDIEERKMPSLYREKMKIAGEMSIVSKRQNQLWKQIKDIHKEIKTN